MTSTLVKRSACALRDLFYDLVATHQNSSISLQIYINQQSIEFCTVNRNEEVKSKELRAITIPTFH